MLFKVGMESGGRRRSSFQRNLLSRTHFRDRINGITYIVPAWVKSKQLYASARHAPHLMIAFTQSF